MKIGRNDPCPCGSGKKYKKCCLSKVDRSKPVDLHYRRLRKASDNMADRLTSFAKKYMDEKIIIESMDEFLGWPEEDDVDVLDLHEEIFLPWFLFHWIYDPEGAEEPLDIPPYRTIANLYAEQKGHRLEALERRLLKAQGAAAFSFFEIVSVMQGQGFRLKDILGREEFDVVEKSGSSNVETGDIVFGQVIQIDHIGMVVSMSRHLIPSGVKPDIIRFRNWLKKANPGITREVLREYDIEIREFFFEIVDDLLTPPELVNSDGDPLCFHTLHYETPSPGFAFDRLHSLCHHLSRKELLDDAGLDKDGGIQRVEIPWDRQRKGKSGGIEGAILGHLAIEDQKLTVQVNSERRARTIRKEIEARLGDAAVYQTTEIQDLDAMMAAGDDGKTYSPETIHAALNGDTGASRSDAVLKERTDAIRDMLRAFGKERLGGQLTGFALRLCDVAAGMEKPSFRRGGMEIWAAAIVHVIARINFLFDPAVEYHVTSEDICSFFGVKKGTVSKKAGQIQDACEIFMGHPAFSLPELSEMLTMYETPEGFIMPGSFLQAKDGKSIVTGNRGQTKPSKGGVEKRQKPKPKPAPKKTDDKQLFLFDDDG